MVEWLLQNSLGPTWLAICKKHGWSAEAESTGVLAQLDTRRAEWRTRREAGAVAPEALMPINGALEEAWKYYVPQPMPAAVVEQAPDSIRDLKLLDPACGSGHFLVVAFDLLVELYREEARHRGESWSDRQIAEWILENNLHGIDIDPRAVQIAAAALYLKARCLAKDAEPRQVNLVAPLLKLATLAQTDASLMKLETDIQKETGIPPELTRQLIAVLEGVDHLGSLLKLGDAIDKALGAHEGIFATTGRQRELFGGAVPTMPLDKAVAKLRVQDLLSHFLAAHAGAEDLGLRLRGQQLSAGLRFASIAKEGAYHLVVGNPPYQGTSKMKNAEYVAKNYPMGKSDLYAAFMERGLQLCRLGGACSMVTKRSWMFMSDYTELREHLLKAFDLRVLGDVDRGAFEEVPDEVVATAMSVFRRTPPATEPSFALQPTPLSDKSRDNGRTTRKRAAVLAQVGRHDFSPTSVATVPGRPLLYWWRQAELETFARAQLLGTKYLVTPGVKTGDDTRFTLLHFEVDSGSLPHEPNLEAPWQFFIKGGAGAEWIEPVTRVLRWRHRGLELGVFGMYCAPGTVRTRDPAIYFRPGVAFTAIGSTFSARAHRRPSIIGNMGASVFTEHVAETLCTMNSMRARRVLQSLNPGMHFEVGDVSRLPLIEVPDAREIFKRVSAAFGEHESHRESSIEYVAPGPSPWRAAQAWAQRAVDRAVGETLPELPDDKDPERPIDHLSFSLGQVLRRSRIENPSGLLFLSPRHDLSALALEPLRRAWNDHGQGVASTLEQWLRESFFVHHRDTYGSRPIYFPLSSSKRSFVAYVSIHRWSASTLTTLLSDYLIPERKALEGSLADLRTARATADKKSRSENDRLFAQLSRWLEELQDFIAKVTLCAEKGPPSEPGTPPREADAPYVMDLDDGVMINAAALWPLLDPMWKDPKKWWKELAAAKGRKDYDWSHLAARYFPSRVDEKCQKDPSLAVAHGCFWKYHSEKAYQWELRLQDEIGPDFLITEKDSDSLRKVFRKQESKRAAELQAAEQVRRERKANKQDQEDLELEAPEDSNDEGEAA